MTTPTSNPNPNSAPFDSKAFLKTLTSLPGVYRMLDNEGRVIYVGKAKNLKKRVSSYFRNSGLAPKTRALVANITAIEITVTHTENEALLLENNLIKQLRPRYNILLRDDKSYPYLYLSADPFPRLGFHRGKRGKSGHYFGPYPSASAVRDSLNLLQKLFPVRQCEEHFYRNRSRPCLQYQIKRCSAPCVGLVSEEAYGEDVRHAVMFLEGKDNAIIDELVAGMEHASEALAFEQAAHYRDQIANLRRVQEKQYVMGEGGDLDVVAVRVANGIGCVQLFFIRGGRNLGNKSYFPSHTAQSDEAELLQAFLPQYYLAEGRSGSSLPDEIIVSHTLPDQLLLQQVLSERAGHKLTISDSVRGDRARWLQLAHTNAEQALSSHLATRANIYARFIALQEAFALDELPQRIECFDISHTMGEATVASCVVFDTNGALKSDYRRYNIEGITPGDDYAAMKQALSRRFKRLKEGEGRYPDILLIDGGKGQLAQAEEVMAELQVVGVLLIGVAKGAERRPGLEQLILSGQARPTILPADSPALHLIQQVRDEAHRFAITGHRQRRAKARRGSVLEGIPGLGPKRRQTLLKQFGGLQEVARAGVEELCKIKGISRQLAQSIYDTLHNDEA
ncbi:MAG: excinuclease ABC subunit UvrC [Chromatiales bacterium]|nr:excinuclease ABC subunit UvrC [Chromatiales bacterium]